jgi:chromosome segregation ATPase
MMWLVRVRIALVLMLGIAFLASVGMILRQYAQLAACQRQRAADLQSFRELQEALRQRDLQQAPAVAEGQVPAGDHRAALAQRDASIEQLKRELTEAHADAARLQAQLLSSSDEHERILASANERYRKDQEDWQSQLHALKQELDSAVADSRASRQRLGELEAADTKLRNESGEGSARAAEFRRVLTSLQDVNRHRDAYLTSIIHRYRDITNQFRAMSGMLDSSRGPNTGNFSGVSLTRIQNAIGLADDDLRQLNDLNAQARQLEEKLLRK